MGDLFDTIYQQDPKSNKGILYNYFLEHQNNQACGGVVQIDVADRGEDALFAAHYIEVRGEIHIQDMFFDTRNSGITIPLLADWVLKNMPREIVIESNGMGSTYKSMLEMYLKSKGAVFYITEKHSTLNKEAKILACVFNLTNKIRFPKDWKIKHKGAYDQISVMTDKSVSKHNDVADCLSEITIRVYGIPGCMGAA
jgi:hypothetical protein